MCILFYFEFYVTVFIYPASAAKHNKRMWNDIDFRSDRNSIIILCSWKWLVMADDNDDDDKFSVLLYAD